LKREEHKAIIQELLGCATPDKQARASELLTQLSDDYEQTTTASETLTNEHSTLKENYEKLRQVNADLFLKVGNTTNTNQGGTGKENESKGQEGSESELTFDKLFNEKGELI
jgi:hypothetical protein